MAETPTTLRLDKWLWAARFFKTRGLAVDHIGKGRVSVNGSVAKPARELHPGDTVELRQEVGTRTVQVLALSAQRGPATVAQSLYAETPTSLRLREAALQARRDGIEPAQSLEHGRPTKRDRRSLVDWQRWSAGIDDSA